MSNTMKLKLLALASLVSVACHAQPEFPKVLDAEYVKSIKMLSEKLTECREAQKPIDISGLVGPSMTKDQLKVVIEYHYSKANFECSKAEYADYLIKTHAASAFLPDDAEKVKDKIDFIVSSSEKYRWQSIESYNALPAKARESAEAASVFGKPFDLMSVLDQLNEID